MAKKINQKEVVEEISLLTPPKRISKFEINLVLDLLRAVVYKKLAQGNKVHLSNLGTFETFFRHAREGVNPSTREKMTIEEIIIPKFRASKILKIYLKKNYDPITKSKGINE